jgi:exodeoxyribonuclease VII small subunit
MSDQEPGEQLPVRDEQEQPGDGEGPDGPESYEAAVARLDEIIARLDSGKAELRETLGLVREGKALVEYCKGELDAVSGELEKLDLDSLVSQLEAAEGE